MIYNPGKGNLVNTSTNQTINGLKNFTSIPTVNNSGVVVSGQNPFIISVSTSTPNINLANTLYYFAGQGASYSQSSTDRPIPILQSSTIKKAVYILQHVTPSTVTGTNVTGYVINTTKNLTGVIFSTGNTTIDNAFYKFANTNLNIPCSELDNVVFAISNTSASVTNLRSMVYLYCYPTLS